MKKRLQKKREGEINDTAIVSMEKGMNLTREKS